MVTPPYSSRNTPSFSSRFELVRVLAGDTGQRADLFFFGDFRCRVRSG